MKFICHNQESLKFPVNQKMDLVHFFMIRIIPNPMTIKKPKSYEGLHTTAAALGHSFYFGYVCITKIPKMVLGDTRTSTACVSNVFLLKELYNIIIF